MAHEADVWFVDGLRFVCTGCGKCCTGASGSVRLTADDIDRLATYLRVPAGRFIRQYTRLLHGERRLIDTPGSRDCVFLKSKACTVYEARPLQCRTFPWWRENLRDEEAWHEAASNCEGIDHSTAHFVPVKDILDQLRQDDANEVR